MPYRREVSHSFVPVADREVELTTPKEELQELIINLLNGATQARFTFVEDN